MYSERDLLNRQKGWDFEVLVFGLSPHDMPEPAGSHFTPPRKLSHERSIHQQIRQNWKRLEKARCSGDETEHNPYQPTRGKTGEICQHVRRNLNKRLSKDDYWPLLLYLSVGRSSLDWHHGVDAFFWWNNVYVTFDVSTFYKQKLKADFLLTPDQLDLGGLKSFGEKVANLLIHRRYCVPPD